jgi:hypothetical protein
VKYRKKPVVIEAEQFDYDRFDELKLKYGLRQLHSRDHQERVAWIVTLEGDMCVCDGDWIITGVKGEKYPCKPDIFAETYEPVEAGA